jgi:hypothetical protein
VLLIYLHCYYQSNVSLKVSIVADARTNAVETAPATPSSTRCVDGVEVDETNNHTGAALTLKEKAMC